MADLLLLLFSRPSTTVFLVRRFVIGRDLLRRPSKLGGLEAKFFQYGPRLTWFMEATFVILALVNLRPK